jgi:alpha-glucosidase (family GH31 glycosyl hydrolase)
MDAVTKTIYAGGQEITVAAELDTIPLFYRDGADLGLV